MVKYLYLIHQLSRIHLNSHRLTLRETVKLSSSVNSLQLAKEIFELESEKLRINIDDLEEYRRKTDYHINKCFETIIRDLNLRRNELMRRIEEHYSVLMKKISTDRELKKDKFNFLVEQIDNININIQKIKDETTDETKLKILKENINEIRAKINLVEKAKDYLTQRDYELRFESDLNMKKILGELVDKNKILPIAKHFILYDNQISAGSEKISHRSEVDDLKLVGDDKLFSASKGGKVKLWDLNTRNCMKTYNIFDFVSSIDCLSFLSSNLLASGSFDKRIQIWNIETGQCCLKIFNAHHDIVTCLKLLSSGTLLSGSSDCTIKKWNYETGECLGELSGHSDAINCLDETENNKILSGSSDRNIRLWDENGNCLKIFEGHQDYVLCIKVLNKDLIASGSKDHTIKIWDQKTGKCEQTLVGHTDPVSCLLPLNNNKLMSGSWQGVVKIWDLESNTCLTSIKAHYDRINCLQTDSKGTRILTGSRDKTIKIFPSIL